MKIYVHVGTKHLIVSLVKVPIKDTVIRTARHKLILTFKRLAFTLIR